MKRVVIFILLVFILLSLHIPSVSAIEIKLSKEIYEPGETLQAEISGPIIENVEYEDISFYSGRTKIPLIYDIAKVNEKYYLYALLPYKERNYTLSVRDVFYKKQDSEVRETLSRDFSIKQTSNYSLAFSPGFVITRNDFSVNLENKGKELKAEALFEATKEKKEVQLSEGASEKISFSIPENKNFSETKIKITAQSQSYSIPVFVLSQSAEDQTANISKLAYLRFVPSLRNTTIKTNQAWLMKFLLINLGDINLTDIELSVDKDDEELDAVLSPKTILELETNEKKEINLSVIAEKQGIFVFEIKAQAKNATASAVIQLNSSSKEVNYTGSGDYEPIDEKECSAKKGKICGDGETCKGEETLAIDGACCLGECVKTGGKSSTKWIGFVLFFIVVVVVILVLIKIKKQKAKKPEEILKAKAKAFEHGAVELQEKK